jgi:hypothetical protein
VKAGGRKSSAVGGEGHPRRLRMGKTKERRTGWSSVNGERGERVDYGTVTGPLGLSDGEGEGQAVT